MNNFDLRKYLAENKLLRESRDAVCAACGAHGYDEDLDIDCSVCGGNEWSTDYEGLGKEFGRTYESEVKTGLLNSGNLPDVPEELEDMIRSEESGHFWNRIIVHLEGGEEDGWYDYNKGLYSEPEWDPIIYDRDDIEKTTKIVFDQDAIPGSEKGKEAKAFKNWLIGMSNKPGYAFNVKEVYLGET